MKTTNPVFWNELTRGKDEDLPKETDEVVEDVPVDTEFEDRDADDSDLTMKVLTRVMITDKMDNRFAQRESGGLMSVEDAENIDSNVHDLDSAVTVDKGHGQTGEINEECVSQGSTRLRRGTRTRKPNKQYNVKSFWRHNDDEASDVDENDG